MFTKSLIMLLYGLQKWWHHHGWFYIVAGSVCLLFFLWIFVARRDRASTNVNMDNIVRMVMSNPSPQPVDFQSVPTQGIRADAELDRITPTRSKGEQICYDVLLEMTGKSFQKVRPDWLVNPITREPMEIDLYNDELKLGVEYNGKQHDEYNEFMHQGSRDKFRNQQYRDYLKKDICKRRGVYLIVVSHKTKHKDIRKFLVTQLRNFLDSFKQEEAS